MPYRLRDELNFPRRGEHQTRAWLAADSPPSPDCAVSAPAVRSALAMAAALEMLAVRALAEPPTDLPGYSLTASSLFEWDPNLFRLPDGVSPRQVGQATDHRGDTIIVPSATIDANFLPGRQRVSLNAQLSRELLLRNSAFDLTSLSYRGSWIWQLGNKWSGELTDSQQQQRTSFADAQLTEANRETTRTHRASADYRPRPDRRLGASFAWIGGSNSLGVRQINDFRTTIARAELGVDSGFGSELVLGASTTHAEYPNQQILALAPIDNSYRQNQFDLSTRYVASEKIQIQVRAGYAKRRYPVVSQRDFGGVVGNLGVTWQPTAKLQAQLTASRDLNAVDDAYRIYTVSTQARAKLGYQPTVKTDFTVDAYGTRVPYKGNPQNFLTSISGPAPYREDRYYGLKFSIGWLPTQRLTAQVTQALETRNSNTAGFQYRDWTTLLYLQYQVGPWH